MARLYIADLMAYDDDFCVNQWINCNASDETLESLSDWIDKNNSNPLYDEPGKKLAEIVVTNPHLWELDGYEPHPESLYFGFTSGSFEMPLRFRLDY